MSNPGLSKCASCGRPIENVRTRIGLIWRHRWSGHQLCNPSVADGTDTWAVPINAEAKS